MENQDKKLSVLAKIAKVLNENKVTWALGASLLLYLKGICPVFHDIDLLVTMKDAKKAEDLLSSLGRLDSPNPNGKYQTKVFREFAIDDVDIDLMAGFVIVQDGHTFDASLKKEQIVETLTIQGQPIPLMSIDLWRSYYEAMGRAEKVKMIDDAEKIGK